MSTNIIMSMTTGRYLPASCEGEPTADLEPLHRVFHAGHQQDAEKLKYERCTTGIALFLLQTTPKCSNKRSVAPHVL